MTVSDSSITAGPHQKGVRNSFETVQTVKFDALKLSLTKGDNVTICAFLSIGGNK